MASMRAQYAKNQMAIDAMRQTLAELREAADALDGISNGTQPHDDALGGVNGGATRVGVDVRLEAKATEAAVTSNSCDTPKSPAVGAGGGTRPRREVYGGGAGRPPPIDYHLMRRVLAEQEARCGGLVDAEMEGGVGGPTAAERARRYGARWYLSVEYWRAWGRRNVHVWLPIAIIIYFNRNAIYFCLQIIFVGPTAAG